MARGTTLTKKCPYCSKTAKEIGRDKFGDDMLILLECGHTIIQPIEINPDAERWRQLLDGWQKNGFEPYPFQIEGVEFIEKADCNALLLDEQGLGKTIQASMLMMRNPEILFPALVVVKSGLRAQWFGELFKLTGQAAQVIQSSRELPLFEFFNIIVVSIDSLRLLRPDVKTFTPEEVYLARMKGKELKVPEPIWTDEICSHFKFICVDESQKIKNEGSARTQALRKVAAAANGGKKARILCMSGTNIEKHSGEYFVTLNLVRPETFYQRQVYISQHCEVDKETGKIGGLKDPVRFKELTKDFIIRRLREDVLPQLPKVFRQFRLAEMEGPELQAYVKVVKEFQEYMTDDDVPKIPTDILGFLSKMRHITGVAKVNAAVDFVEEFLLESERKLVVFLHHKLAGEILMQKLRERMKEGAFAPPLYLSSDLDAFTERPALVEEFRKPENRIMVASTLASAEGLNLQFCSDCLLMERQWNPSTEEQVEGRFPRPGQTADKINAHYLIAAGTIDDFFTDIVEGKRRNVKQTLDGIETVWDETSLLGELTKVLTSKGLAKWRL